MRIAEPVQPRGMPGTRRNRAVRSAQKTTTLLLACSAAAAMCAIAALAEGSDAATGSGPPFVVDTNAYVLGQAADWLDGTFVVWHDAINHDEDGDGEGQIQ